MRALLPMLIFLLRARAAFAADACASRDFRPQLGPARDQGDLSWCYAFTAADLATQALHRQLKGKQVSAADMAVKFISEPAQKVRKSANPALKQYLQEHPDFFEMLAKQRADGPPLLTRKGITTEKGLVDYGGDSASALVLANLRGVCLEEKYPAKADQVLQDLGRAELLLAEEEMREGMRCTDLPQPDVTSQIVEAGANAIVHVYRTELHVRCGNRYLPEPPLLPEEEGEFSLKAFSSRFGHDREGRRAFQDHLIDRMNAQLDQGKVVGIGYDVYSIMRRDADDTDPFGGDHASSIVGRKSVGGKCYYLLQNSFGATCAGYRAPLGKRCEAGHLWLTKEELEKGLYSILYLR